MMVGLPDVVTRAKLDGDRFSDFRVVGGRISGFPIDFASRPYNTLALPCQSVITLVYKLFFTLIRFIGGNVTALFTKFLPVSLGNTQRKKYVTSSLFKLLSLRCDWSDTSMSRIRIGNRKKRTAQWHWPLNVIVTYL